MKIVTILGTRPNFIKHYALGSMFEAAGITDVVVHTGQHFDTNMSGNFFQELGIKRPNYMNELVKSTPAQELAGIMSFVEGVLYREKPDATVVYGDVTSTMAAALSSSRLGIPVAHVEAGARGGLFYNSEEVNRRVTETVADLLFAHIPEAQSNLLQSGYSPDKIILTGDIMQESLTKALSQNDISVDNKGYVLFSTHRAENTDNPDRLKTIVEAVRQSSKKVLFPVHPRTEKALKRYDLWTDVATLEHVTLMPPQGYLDNIRLLASCDRVVSDSGGLRREAYMVGKPVVSLTNMIWVQAMVDAGWKHVADADTASILYGIEEFSPPNERPDIFGDSEASTKIVKALKARYGNGYENQNRSTLCTTGIQNGNSIISDAIRKREASLPIRLDSKHELISVVTPCYNEEEGLPVHFYRMEHLRRIIDGSKYRLEFVLVNDGSTDNTARMLEESLGELSYVKIIHLEKNQGFGGALKEGFKHAEGDIIITVDADTNYDLLDAPKLIDMMQPDTDIVTGSPFMEGGDWDYPAHRYIMSLGVAKMYKLVLGAKAQNIGTFTCGFRAYRRQCLEDIWPKADDFLATAELLVKGLLADKKTRECPVVNYDRKFGVSKLRTLRTARAHLYFLKNLLKGRLSGSWNHAGDSIPKETQQ